MSILGETFETGAPVEAHGVYVCAPCGFKKTLKLGDTFPECDSCTRDKKNEEEADPDDVPEPSGIWEFVGEGEDDEGDESKDEDEKETGNGGSEEDDE